MVPDYYSAVVQKSMTTSYRSFGFAASEEVEQVEARPLFHNATLNIDTRPN